MVIFNSFYFLTNKILNFFYLIFKIVLRVYKIAINIQADLTGFYTTLEVRSHFQRGISPNTSSGSN